MSIGVYLRWLYSMSREWGASPMKRCVYDVIHNFPSSFFFIGLFCKEAKHCASCLALTRKSQDGLSRRHDAGSTLGPVMLLTASLCQSGQVENGDEPLRQPFSSLRNIRCRYTLVRLTRCPIECFDTKSNNGHQELGKLVIYCDAVTLSTASSNERYGLCLFQNLAFLLLVSLHA